MTSIEAGVYIEQLTSLRKFPKGPKAIEALAKHFARHAWDSQHAERIVAAILDTGRDWPGPAAIREAAASTSEAGSYERSESASQMERWRREYETNVEPWLCPDCRGLGSIAIVDEKGKVLRYDVCGCPEGDVQWIDPATGRRCSPNTPGAVERNSEQWMRKLNAMAAMGRTPSAPAYATRKAAAVETADQAGERAS